MHRYANIAWWGGHDAAANAARTEPTAPHVETAQFPRSYVSGHVPAEHAKGVADPTPYELAVVDRLPVVYAEAEAAHKEATRAATKVAAEMRKAKATAAKAVAAANGLPNSQEQVPGQAQASVVAEQTSTEAATAATATATTTVESPVDGDDDFDLDLDDADEDYGDELDLHELAVSAEMAATLEDIDIEAALRRDAEATTDADLADSSAAAEEVAEGEAVDGDDENFAPETEMMQSLQTCISEEGKEAGCK